MQQAVEHTASEFRSLHTGKATSAMVENLAVEGYGNRLKLKEIATITVPDARTIQIQPWDRGMVPPIEKAILLANIGLSPVTTGLLIRCLVPEMSGDRRKELIKVAHGMAEEGRVGVRAVRQEFMSSVKQAKKVGPMSEDELSRIEKEIQKQTDQAIAAIDDLLAKKEKELLSI
jgi:ribosome recycling factor